MSPAREAPAAIHVIANLVLFQVGWFACVLGGANGLPWLGPLFVVLIAAWHLRVVPRPRREFLLLTAVTAVGAFWDSLLVAMGWLVYPSGVVIAGTAPFWIVAMWCLFATTLNVSLRWFRHRPVLAAIAGAVAGPLAYYAGHRLGGVTFPDTAAAMIVLAGGWAFWMPVLLALAERLDGFAQDNTAKSARLATESAG